MLTGLILCKSCIGNHNCSEFMNSLVLNIQKTLYQYDLPRSLALTFIMSFFHDGPQASMAALEVRQVFHLCWACHWHLFSALGPIANFWVNRHKCKKNLLCWGQRAMLISLYRDVNFDDILILWLFSKVTKADSSLGDMSSPTWVLNQIYCIRHSLLLWIIP